MQNSIDSINSKSPSSPSVDGGVQVLARPFGISSATGLMTPDGVVFTGRPNIELAVLLANSLDYGLRDVTVEVDRAPEASTGVRMLSSKADVGNIGPGGTYTVRFLLDTTTARPGKYTMWLLVRGVDPAGRESISRTKGVFFVATHLHGMFDRFKAPLGDGEFDVPRIWTSVAPEGSVTVEIRDWLADPVGARLPFPRSTRMGMTPAAPFKGQYSPLPFSDPVWKGLGVAAAEIGVGKLAAVAAGATVAGVAAGSMTASSTNASTGVSVGVGIGVALVVGGVALGFLDGCDVFLWGESRTPVDSDEYTIREEAFAELLHLDQPFAALPLGVELSGWAQWTFVRVTNKRLLRVSERVRVWTEHFVPTRTVLAAILHGPDGPVLQVDARFAKPDARLQGGRLHCIAYAVSSDGGELVIPMAEVQASEQSHGDKVRFEGLSPLPAVGGERAWEIYVLAQDINRACPDDPMLVQAESLGGVVVSAPRIDARGVMEPDFRLYQGATPEKVPSRSLSIPAFA